VTDEQIYNVLFICAGNSARGIFGECLLDRFGQGRFPGYRTGSHPNFHDPHGEPLESFIAVRDDIRGRLVPAVREALGI
jgi:arsenate reductase